VEQPVPEVVPDFSSLPAPVRVSAAGDVKVHPYLIAIQRKIEQNWKPYKEDPRMSVVVSFSIARDGNVSDIRIVTSSGDQVLDGNARSAVERSNPFGRVPPIFTGERLEITCTLRPTRR
jgi:TonB family protein